MKLRTILITLILALAAIAPVSMSQQTTATRAQVTDLKVDFGTLRSSGVTGPVTVSGIQAHTFIYITDAVSALTLTFEGFDGASWATIGTGSTITGGTVTSSTVYSAIRITYSITGTGVQVIYNGTSAPLSTTVTGTVTATQGSANTGLTTGWPISIKQGGNTATVGSDGALLVNAGSPDATYMAAAAAFAFASSPTDIGCITGSASTTVYVRQLIWSGTASGLTQATFALIKRSTANTGGTTVDETEVPLDSSNAAATATVVSYTANAAALGTAVGTILARINHWNTTGSSSNTLTLFDATGADNNQPVVLRGTAESLCLNVSATVAGNSNRLTWLWTER